MTAGGPLPLVCPFQSRLEVRVWVSSCHILSLVGSRPDALSQNRCLLAAQEEVGGTPVTQLRWNPKPACISQLSFTLQVFKDCEESVVEIFFLHSFTSFCGEDR